MFRNTGCALYNIKDRILLIMWFIYRCKIKNKNIPIYQLYILYFSFTFYVILYKTGGFICQFFLFCQRVFTLNFQGGKKILEWKCKAKIFVLNWIMS